MAVLQGEQARQAMARMQWRATAVPAVGAAQPVALQPVAAAAPLRRSEDAQRACA